MAIVYYDYYSRKIFHHSIFVDRSAASTSCADTTLDSQAPLFYSLPITNQVPINIIGEYVEGMSGIFFRKESYPDICQKLFDLEKRLEAALAWICCLWLALSGYLARAVLQIKIGLKK